MWKRRKWLRRSEEEPPDNAGAHRFNAKTRRRRDASEKGNNHGLTPMDTDTEKKIRITSKKF